MKRSSRAVLTLAAFAGLGVNAALAAEIVTVDSFVRAQSDVMFKYYASRGGFGKFMHVRGMTPVDKQSSVRMNRDTLRLPLRS